jgi:4-amino-4-deoxy-L-arabinose transferase-like glycosyltransferase
MDNRWLKKILTFMGKQMKQESSVSFNIPSLMSSSHWLTLILLLGFVVRVFWWAYAQPIPVSDFEDYRQLGEGLLKYGQLGYPNPTAHRLPVYPAFLAVMMQISYSVKWLSFVNVLLSTTLIYLVYLLTLSLTSKTTLSIVAALICALNPAFIFYSSILASENLFSVLLLFSFILLFNHSSTQSTVNIFWPYILSGILFGAAVLTRGEGLFYLPIYAAMGLFAFKSKKQKFIAVCVPVLACIVTVLPWYLRNYFVIAPGSGLATNSGETFYLAHNEKHYGLINKDTPLYGLGQVERNKLGYQLGIQYIHDASLWTLLKDIAVGTCNLYLSGTDSIYWSTRYQSQPPPHAPYPYKQLRGDWLFARWAFNAYSILLIGAMLSCIFFPRYPSKMWFILYGIVVMNWIGYAVVFFAQPRYRFMAEVMFCILASITLYEVIIKRFSLKIKR